MTLIPDVVNVDNGVDVDDDNKDVCVDNISDVVDNVDDAGDYIDIDVGDAVIDDAIDVDAISHISETEYLG